MMSANTKNKLCTFADGNGNSGNAELSFKPINVIGLILINKAKKQLSLRRCPC